MRWKDFSNSLACAEPTYARRPESTALFLESAAVQLGKNSLGEFGQLSPAVAKDYDLRDAVLLAEFNLDLLLSLSRRNAAVKTFKPLPAFPAIRRDVAMLVPEATTHEAVLNAVKSAKPQNLERAELFERLPRKKCSRRQQKHGLRLHLSQPRADAHRC